MPYGHIRQYEDLVQEAQAKRMRITRRQKRQIADLYGDIASEFGHSLAGKSEKSLQYRWLKDYAKSLKGQSESIYKELQGIVGNSILDTAKATTGAQEAFWGGIAPRMSERFRDVFSTIPKSCVDELMNGGIYKDFTGLSERLWNYQGKFNQDIGYIINRGILEQKSAYDLAKDLELYLKPGAAKPWKWQKVYPRSNQMVDYNAQRLARTSVTHAYQLSFQRSTQDNPFIERYQWHSSNGGRTCDLCRQRDGKLFDKDDVPLDHPNGVCIITAVITKSYYEIAEELNDWVNGGENPALDRWLFPDEDEDAKGLFKGIFRQNISKQLDSFDRHVKYISNPHVSALLQQSRNRVEFKKSYEQRSYYSHKDGKVYLSADAKGDVIAHELFHEIDEAYGITSNGALTENILLDYRNIVLNAEKNGKTIIEMLYSTHPEAFRKNGAKLKAEYRPISDMLSGASGGELRLGFGHSAEYWKKPKKVEKEVWAQFGRIEYQDDDQVWILVNDLFPNVSREIFGILERMIK
ncbi:hypothetical protein LQE92_08875 [Lacrimispora sp. NSJ-141]|uniref:Phage head morphogenesis domain-containing protein n=1 Tax=Lientehia hominis TaxID=2897778 RepID=A0AAP2RJG0_9FIRM|nr:phage minor head protein [Lientehia hominis]MCD2492740.1 hypothetical protein [Lientehia hominis]